MFFRTNGRVLIKKWMSPSIETISSEKSDPYPIKTYIDYELDRDKFEEKKVDPITPTLEFLGGIGKNEQIWIQILVQANKGKKDPTTPWKGRDWQGEAKELIAKIMEDAKDRSGAVSEEGNDFQIGRAHV